MRAVVLVKRSLLSPLFLPIFDKRVNTRTAGTADAPSHRQQQHPATTTTATAGEKGERAR